jgi:hypothetical protein
MGISSAGVVDIGGNVVLDASDIGSTVQAYDADTAKYDDATANFTGTLYAPQIVASNGIFLNSTTVSANFTIPNNYHALSVGPVSIDGGVSVTVPSGSNWKVI